MEIALDAKEAYSKRPSQMHAKRKTELISGMRFLCGLRYAKCAVRFCGWMIGWVLGEDDVLWGRTEGNWCGGDRRLGAIKVQCDMDLSLDCCLCAAVDLRVGVMANIAAVKHSCNRLGKLRGAVGDLI